VSPYSTSRSPCLWLNSAWKSSQGIQVTRKFVSQLKKIVQLDWRTINWSYESDLKKAVVYSEHSIQFCEHGKSRGSWKKSYQDITGREFRQEDAFFSVTVVVMNTSETHASEYNRCSTIRRTLRFNLNVSFQAIEGNTYCRPEISRTNWTSPVDFLNWAKHAVDFKTITTREMSSGGPNDGNQPELFWERSPNHGYKQATTK